jgi:hypothetical protein
VILVITIKHKGNFNKTEKFFRGVITSDYVRILEKYAKEGVTALAAATPKDSGETANSWGYELRHYPGGVSITWTNSNVVDGVPIAILLQYGHATRSGGYVQGRDFINPALQPLFDKIAEDIWKEVTKL